MPAIKQARGWYPAVDPVHGFDHVVWVYARATRTAEVEIFQAAVRRLDVQGRDSTNGPGQ